MPEKTPKRSEDQKSEAKYEGFPYQAYALVQDKNKPATWGLLHHTKLINKALKGKVGIERSVDWKNIAICAQYLSLYGVEGKRAQGEPDAILAAAQHLATHYRKAGKALPDALAVLV